jgi:hypothetical protein
MRLIAWSTLASFTAAHPATRPALEHWRKVVKADLEDAR